MRRDVVVVWRKDALGRRALTAWVLAVGLSATVAAANNPPNPPAIFEPPFDGVELNAADVHMVSAFSDPDAGDTHQASDYEIWNDALTERAWRALNVTGVEKIHIHLGDGVFENSHAGRTTLYAGTAYKLKVRHQDDGGLWGPYAVRPFVTGSLSAIFPMEAEDIVTSPAPTWRSTGGAAIVLPSAGTQPFLRVESEDGSGLLLEFRGLNGTQNQVTNPAPLADHEHIRVHVDAGSVAGGLVLPETNLSFRDEDGDDQTVYLPPTSLTQGQSAVYWVSVNGSTYFGNAGQTEPDFSDLARGAPVPWTVSDARFKVEIVATGFRLPVHLAFVPNPGPNPMDPFYYVTELHDGVKVVTRNGTVLQYATGILNFTASGQFSGPGETGVTGIAVDPATGDLFVGLMYSLNGSGTGPWSSRIVKMTSNNGGMSMASMTTLVDDAPEAYSYSHVVGEMSIGPDGKLYVQIGEGNEAAAAQNLDVFKGKILRMNLDGTAPTDNPFYNGGNPGAKRNYVWAYGYRNPFGGAWRDVTGGRRLYTVENGPFSDRLSKSGPGHNNNWGTAGDSDGSMFFNAIHIWSPPHAPTGAAFIQASDFNNSGFPADKVGRLFVTESGPTAGVGPWAQGKRIVEFQLHSNPDISPGLAKLSGPTTLVEYTGSGRATALGLAAGPDGLYFTDLYKDFGGMTEAGGNVLRVRFTGVGSITGTVRDLGGAPISGATVSTSPGNYMATTLANGTYTIPNVFTGTYTVTAQKPGYSTETVPAVQVVQNQAVVVDFALEFGVTDGTISGAVKDAANNPLVGASVRTLTGGYSTTALAGGTYLLDDVSPGTYAVEASMAGFVTATNPNVTVNAGQNTVVNFVLAPIAPFDGIANGGFEGGFHNDPDVDHQTGNSWSQFTLSGFSKSGGHATIKHSGTWSQAFWESSYVSGIRQQAGNASVGSLYTGSVWVRGFGITFWVGLDPGGGTEPQAGTVQWSDPATPGDTWVQISKQVSATAGAVTLFVKTQNPSALNRSAFIDDADIAEQYIPPAAPTISRSPATLARNIEPGENAASQTFTVANSGDGTLNYSIGDNVGWLSTTPSAGDSTGEPDIITVDYATAGLAAGTHNATITISDPAATNHPQTIGVTVTVASGPPPVPGDFDGDEDVDLEDYGRFQACYTGPGVAQEDANCADAKLDGDVDVDGDDFGVFQGCLSGANVAADAGCAGGSE